MKKHIRPAIMLTLLLTIVCGFIYPGIVTGIAQLVFPYQANGSLHSVNGQVIGSDLIGQYWTADKYFHGRPSATTNPSNSATPEPYAADNSAASNLGPTNKNLITTVQQRTAALQKENPGTPVPVDLVTASASGLDPDISVAAADFQIPRVASARGISNATLQNLIDQNTTGRFLGIFGEPYVNVLNLNVALDNLK